MMMLFKFLKGCHIEETNLFPTLSERRTRPNRNKLEEIRRKFLIVGAVQKGNRLSREVVDWPSLNIFKQRLDRYLLEICLGDFLIRPRVGLDGLVSSLPAL